MISYKTLIAQKIFKLNRDEF